MQCTWARIRHIWDGKQAVGRRLGLGLGAFEPTMDPVATSTQGRANLRLLQSQLGKNHCKLSTMVGEHFEMTVL